MEREASTKVALVQVIILNCDLYTPGGVSSAVSSCAENETYC